MHTSILDRQLWEWLLKSITLTLPELEQDTKFSRVDSCLTMFSSVAIVTTHNLFVTLIQGATKLRGKIEPNEKPAEIPDSVQKGVHVTNKATGDNIMT